MAKIKACMKCGSKSLKPIFDFITGSDFLCDRMRCMQCGHEGVPLEFNSDKSRKLFESRIKAKRKPGKLSRKRK